jgi:hypothetical protein
MRRLLSFVAVGFAVQYALGGVAGCSSADPVKKTEPATGKKGTLSLNLESVSQSGKVYRLRDATFFVNPAFVFPTEPFPPPFPGGSTGFGGAPSFPDGGIEVGGGAGGPIALDGGFPQGGFVGSGGFFGGDGGFFTAGSVGAGGFVSPGSGSFTLSSEENPDEPVIERFLAPGGYEIDLFPGWFIEQVDSALGTSAQVPATLESSEFQLFNISSDQETFVRFDFLVDGSRVSFGSPGRLIVGIGINETNGGAFCGDGVMQQGEDCDGFDLGKQTCASVTMGSRPIGTLFCTANCQFDTTFCQSGFTEGGTGGFGTGGSIGTGGGLGSADGSVGLPSADAGMGPGAGGSTGMPIP